MPSKPFTIVMPEDGWDHRAVSFFCEFCGSTVTMESDFLNLDALLDMGMTQAEFFKEIHLNDHADLDYVDDRWVRKTGDVSAL